MPLRCYGSSLGSNPDVSQKYKMVDISKEVANTLTRNKKVFYPIGDGDSSNKRGRVLSQTRIAHNTLEEVVFFKIYLKITKHT
jgi:hypothetical protein